MITSVILSFASTLTPMATGTQSGAAISTATNPTRAQTAQQKKAPRLIRDLNGKVLGDEATADLALGGDFYNPFVGRRSATAYLYGTWEVTLNDTGTAWQEKFLIGLPRHPQWPTPMLVAFHGWGSTQEDIIIRTRYFQKAMARGWVVVAPLGAHQFNYSIDYSQKNTEAVLDWVMSYFAIDSDRIYGVGFSMGGGSVSTYAARHQDPTHARFAAIVDHTGTVSIRDIWTHALDKSLLEHELMFEGSPMQVPFRYQSASVIDLDASGQIDPNADLARNLIRTPVKVFAVAGDPNAHLVEESIDFHGHLTGLGGTPQLEIDPGTTHRWTNLPEDEALDWLQQYRLVNRRGPVRVLADRSARWYHFTITAAIEGQFSPFRWALDEMNNRVVLDQIENISKIRFRPAGTGLPTATFEVMLNLTNPGPIDVVLEGYEVPPSSVTQGDPVVHPGPTTR